MNQRYCPDCNFRTESLTCPGCGAMTVRLQPFDDLRDPFIGRLVAGRYRILDLIGRGGMGCVYAADQISMRRRVALKLIYTGDCFNGPLNRQMYKRFKREALAASRLEHHNTVRVFDFGMDDDGLLFMAMELLHGQTLGDIIARGPVPPPRLIPIAIQVCRSLAEAHQKGVIHRDLKPDNIFIYDAAGEKDLVKVLDFGIAKIVTSTEESGITSKGTVVGTATYIAPEQARGLDVVPASDLYSLGVILYESLTGHVPFDASSPLAIMMKHIREPIPPLAGSIPEDTPPELVMVIEKLLEKKPEMRPGSAVEVAWLLASLALGGNLPTRSPLDLLESDSILTPTGKSRLRNMLTTKSQDAATDASSPGRRRAKIALVAGAVLMAVAASVAVFWIFGG